MKFKIKQLEKQIKQHKKEIRKIQKELKELDKDKKRIQAMWESKTVKEAKRKFHTIHIQKHYLNLIISNLLDKRESKLDVIFNHL